MRGLQLKRLLSNKKGIVLIASTLAVVLVLGLSATFFMRSVSEKRFVDVEKFNMQADFLAESGAHHGLSELRERIQTDLSSRISQIVSEATISNYYEDEGGSLEFLVDFAYAPGDTPFYVEEGGTEATLTLDPLVLVTEIDGTYSLKIVVTVAQAPENPPEDTYVFYYNYATEGIGTSSAISPNIIKQVSLLGSFSITVIPDNLANYALFTVNHETPTHGLVWFVNTTNFYGPVHTNDRFSFAFNPSGHFTHGVTQFEETARFHNNWDNLLLDDDRNEDIDVPEFSQDFDRGVDEIDLELSVDPDDVKLQALGGMGEPSPAGIYVPHDEDNILTGGIYIKGNVSQLELAVVSNNSQYTITQGATTKIITVDYDGEGSTTVVEEGEDPVTYTGIPDGIDDEGIVIYSINKIEQLSGVIHGDSEMSISSEKDIVISGHLRYEDYDVGPPVNATGFTNILGIISWEGDVRIGTSAPNNVEIHGIVMAPEGVFTVDNYKSRPDQGTLTLLGGVITEYYGPFGTIGWMGRTGYGRNFVYDERVLSGSIPPYFPSLTTFSSQDDGLNVKDRPLWRKD